MATYLDTSAINALFNDPSKDHLIQTITARGSVYISVLNIIEVAATRDPERRRGLINLLRELSGEYRPLALPYELLQLSLDCFLKRKEDMNWSIGKELDPIWSVLNHPEQLTDEFADEMLEFKAGEEKKFAGLFSNARADFQQIPRDQIDHIRTPSRLLKHYHSTRGFLDEFFKPFFKVLGYETQMAGKANALFTQLEPWIFYFSAYACQIFHRNVKREGFSAKINAGSFDSQQALYLACCDCFVTNDRAQYKALRLVSRLGHKRRPVIPLAQFRR